MTGLISLHADFVPRRMTDENGLGRSALRADRAYRLSALSSMDGSVYSHNMLDTGDELAGVDGEKRRQRRSWGKKVTREIFNRFGLEFQNALWDETHTPRVSIIDTTPSDDEIPEELDPEEDLDDTHNWAGELPRSPRASLEDFKVVVPRKHFRALPSSPPLSAGHARGHSDPGRITPSQAFSVGPPLRKSNSVIGRITAAIKRSTSLRTVKKPVQNKVQAATPTPPLPSPISINNKLVRRTPINKPKYRPSAPRATTPRPVTPRRSPFRPTSVMTKAS